jgi:excisionase family DNA binding protein
MPRHYRPHSLLTFAQAAEVLGLSRWTVRDLADDCRFPTYVLPGCPRKIRRIRYSDVLAFKAQIAASESLGSRRCESV